MNTNTSTNQEQNNGTQQEVTQQQATVQDTSSSVQSVTSVDDTPKFSQNQLNAIIKDRLSSMQAKLNQANADLASVKAKANDFEQKYNDLQNTQLIADKGVSADFRDYVLYESKKIVAADAKKSMADAISEVVEAKKSMLGIQTSNGQSTQTQGNPNQVQGRQPVTVGNTNTQGNANNSGSTVDAEVQAFLDKKFRKRR